MSHEKATNRIEDDPSYQSGRRDLYHKLDMLLSNRFSRDLVPGWHDMTVEELIEASKMAAANATEQMKQSVVRSIESKHKNIKHKTENPSDFMANNEHSVSQYAALASRKAEEQAQFFNDLFVLLIAYSGPKDKRISVLFPELAEEAEKIAERKGSMEENERLSAKILSAVDAYFIGTKPIADQLNDLDECALDIKVRNHPYYASASEPLQALVDYILSDEWKNRNSNELTDPAVVKLTELKDAVF